MVQFHNAPSLSSRFPAGMLGRLVMVRARSTEALRFCCNSLQFACQGDTTKTRAHTRSLCPDWLAQGRQNHARSSPVTLKKLSSVDRKFLDRNGFRPLLAASPQGTNLAPGKFPVYFFCTLLITACALDGQRDAALAARILEEQHSQSVLSGNLSGDSSEKKKRFVTIRQRSEDLPAPYIFSTIFP
jgi:hypothetical protein